MTKNNSSFQIEHSVLAIFGYSSGAKAGLRSKRRKIIEKTFRADLKKFLSQEQFIASQAEYWGVPQSSDRKQAIMMCLKQPLHGWRGKKQFADAVRHREEDIEFADKSLVIVSPG